MKAVLMVCVEQRRTFFDLRLSMSFALCAALSHALSAPSALIPTVEDLRMRDPPVASQPDGQPVPGSLQHHFQDSPRPSSSEEHPSVHSSCSTQSSSGPVATTVRPHLLHGLAFSLLKCLLLSVEQTACCIVQRALFLLVAASEGKSSPWGLVNAGQPSPQLLWDGLVDRINVEWTRRLS
jgi:hypothetical protein